MTIFGYVLEASGAVAALILARRRRWHWPFVWYALLVAVSDPARAALHLLRPYAPRTGGRWLMAADTATWAIEPLGLVVCACAAWTPRAWPHGAGLSAAVVVGLCLAWPWGAPQVALACVVGASLCVTAVLYAREAYGGRWRGKPTTTCLVILASMQSVLLLGPWAAPDAWAAWSLGHDVTIAAWLAITALQVAWIAEARS